jgi:spore germination protein
VRDKLRLFAAFARDPATKLSRWHARAKFGFAQAKLMKDLKSTFDLLSSRLREYLKDFQPLSHQKIDGEVKAAKKGFFLTTGFANLTLIFLIVLNIMFPMEKTASNIITSMTPLRSLTTTQTEVKLVNHQKEVFGFAPFWTFDKIDNADFQTLTTMSYFGVPVLSNGDLDRSDQGYVTFKSDHATNVFKKAHQNGTRVVLTLTQMEGGTILALMDNPAAQENVIHQAVGEVQQRGIDGINVDFEYGSDPGPQYRAAFTRFVANLTQEMHNQNPNSKVTVSVYAGSVKEPKIYDIGALAQNSDGIFMMAYDFANISADQVMPTAPLYGAKQGQYWYDVSSAVDDFLTVMPANKLILGVPWYGYNYAVYLPETKSQTLNYYSSAYSQPYATAEADVAPNRPGVVDYREGWDDLGQVGYKAYYTNSGLWRMIFLEDTRSLTAKYDFAKAKDLGGVGIWALGFEDGHSEMWSLLRSKFGVKLAEQSIVNKAIL